MGPQHVVERRNNTYDCQDLHTKEVRSYDVTRLKPYLPDTAWSNEEVATLDTNSFLVESIVDHRGSVKKKSKMTFRVRWEGFSEHEDTWEPYAEMKKTEAFLVYVKDKGLKL